MVAVNLVHATVNAGPQLLAYPALGDVDMVHAEVDLDANAMGLGFPTVPVATTDSTPGWEVYAASMTARGTKITTTDGRRGANVVHVTKRLVGRKVEVSWAIDVPKAADPGLAPIVDEVQITRNGHLHAWGPVITRSRQGTSGANGYAGRGAEWYLERTVLGDPERLNFLTNPGFESDLTGWVTGGTVSATVITSPTARGAKAVRLTSSTPESHDFLEQSFVHDNSRAAYGYWYHVKAWCVVETFTKAAAGTFGLWVRYTNGTTTRDSWEPINAATPTGQLIALETKVLGMPRTAGIVTVRLYCPQGTVVWDACQVVGNNFTGPNTVEGTDQVLMARELVRVAQEDPNKSSKNIGKSTPRTGVLYAGKFEHSRHEYVDTAIGTVLDHDDGADYAVVTTPTTRVFTTYYPRISTTGTALDFAAGGTKAADYALSADGSQAASAVIALGSGDGPAREEGGAIDATVFGGKILDRVMQAPNESPISVLDGIAEQELWRAKALPTSIVYTVTGDRVDLYEPGMILTASYDDLDESWSGTARVVEVRHDPQAGTAAVTVEPWSDPDA